MIIRPKIVLLATLNALRAQTRRTSALRVTLRKKEILLLLFADVNKDFMIILVH